MEYGKVEESLSYNVFLEKGFFDISIFNELEIWCIIYWVKFFKNVLILLNIYIIIRSLE